MDMCEYLISHHKNELLKILEADPVTNHYSLLINFVTLIDDAPVIGSQLLTTPAVTLENFNLAAVEAQRLILKDAPALKLKNHVVVRIYGLPTCPELHRSIFRRNADINSFLRIVGTVVRVTKVKMLEFKRNLVCTKCKFQFDVEAAYELKYHITLPKSCPNAECKGTKFVKGEDGVLSENCKDYQEIKVQEQINNLNGSTIPNSMWVTLEDDLVDSCKPGDDVGISGVIWRRSGNIYKQPRIPDVELVMRANYVEIYNEKRHQTVNIFELDLIRNEITEFWNKTCPLEARHIILSSICPKLYGLSLVKLAVALVLARGSKVEANQSRTESHILLIGDPGTGKSQLLRWVSKIIPRCILTTGIGSTAAGLTVTALMEDGHWQLEAGALVLADGGVCCIDEFTSMREHDRVSIHEAMEQQTISIAKAGMVCKLNTKCSIIAATNFKGAYDPTEPLGTSVAIASPLLSRFDLVLVLIDSVDEAWDNIVADSIIDDFDFKVTEDVWSIEKLQAYFLIIRSLDPVLSVDANTILQSYYGYQRQRPSRNAARTTVRLLDSLIRLSQAHARLMFRNEVIVLDAVSAIYLCEVSTQPDVLRKKAGDPKTEYIEIATRMLEKLQLLEILEREKLLYENHS